VLKQEEGILLRFDFIVLFVVEAELHSGGVYCE
jgi:hypothetical protein